MPPAAPLPDVRLVNARTAEVITVGTDGCYWGGMALDWAARHACLRGASLQVLRASDHVPSDVPADLGLSHTHRLYPLLPITSRPVASSPVADLTAASTDSTLLVIGCRGHRRFGLGEHVMPTLAGARCDVVVVRGTPQAVHGGHRSVTAMVSGGPHDLAVLHRAAQFSASHRAHLRVVHTAPEQFHDCRSPEDVLHIAELQLKALEIHVRTSFSLIRQLPHEALQHLADADLLVLSRGDSHRRIGTPGPFTKTALYHAPCPVLVIHP